MVIQAELCEAPAQNHAGDVVPSTEESNAELGHHVHQIGAGDGREGVEEDESNSGDGNDVLTTNTIRQLAKDKRAKRDPGHEG